MLCNSSYKLIIRNTYSCIESLRTRDMQLWRWATDFGNPWFFLSTIACGRMPDRRTDGEILRGSVILISRQFVTRSFTRPSFKAPRSPPQEIVNQPRRGYRLSVSTAREQCVNVSPGDYYASFIRVTWSRPANICRSCVSVAFPPVLFAWQIPVLHVSWRLTRVVAFFSKTKASW